MATYQALPNQVSVPLPYISQNLKKMSSLVKKLKSRDVRSQLLLLITIELISYNLADIFRSQKPKPEVKWEFETLGKHYNELKKIFTELDAIIHRRSDILIMAMSIDSGERVIQFDALAYKIELDL